MQNNLEISLYGFFTSYGGYGIVNTLLAKYLKRVGVDVSIHAKFAPKTGSDEWKILNREERSLFCKSFVKRRIGIIQTNPFDFDMLDTEIKIAVTMCESDGVSHSWPEKLNSMDYIIVPNEFCKRVFIKSGVTKPIKIISYGADAEKFDYCERPKRKVFTFGIVGYLDATDRKGAFDVIRAFTSEFEADEPVRLILKSSEANFGYYSNFSDKRITTIARNLNYQDLSELYRILDCFVFPSKAEGIGLPPQEAMLTGLPVILTNWSGMEDIAKSDISYPLNPIRFEKRPNFIEQDGHWAIIDIQELMYWMRYVYEHQNEAKNKGKKAAQFMRENFSWDKCAGKLKVFLESL